MANAWKLTPVLATATAAGVLLAGVFLAIYIDRNNQNQKLNEVTVQADILASTATAALSFKDQAAAQEYVNAVGADPELETAAIYEANGALLARYARVDDPATEPLPPLGHGIENGRLTVVEPVNMDGKRLGFVVLRTMTETMARRLSRYGLIASLVVMACVLLAVLALAQQTLTGANAKLARANAQLEARARDLADANNNLRDQIERREQIEEALRQSQKMEAIGQLTGGVAHDFNNLLQVITGNLERLQMWARRKSVLEDQEFARASGSAMLGAQRAATLTQRLLAFSRRQPLSAKPIDLNKLVSGMSDLLLRTLGETIRIETVLAGGLWQTLVDENQLENAVLNLAVNARDAMPGGGRLTIETANAFLDEVYAREQDDVEPGQYVQISVSDTGSGMTKETLDHVFEPFFTTKDVGHGTGLGLSMVYGFVKQTGGHIRLYSEVGEGTTVKLYLPRSKAEGTAERRPEVKAAPFGDGERIMVVEDEEEVRTLTIQTLRDLGYVVLEAPDGHAALGLLEQGPDIRLLFTDVGLPGGMNGRQLADEAQRRCPGLRVLFTTGYARNAIVHQGRLDPGVELITKPFSRNDLAHKVRMMLDTPRAA